MNSRREFIKNVALAIPAFSLAEFMFSSCNPAATAPHVKRVGIIGAGVAGLNAAMILKQTKRCSVEILEAGDWVGGRILTCQNSAFSGNGNVELGADMAWGADNNAWLNIIEPYHPQRVASATKAYIIDDVMKKEEELNQDADFKKMNLAINSTFSYASNDQSLEQFMENSDVPERVKHFYQSNIESCIGGSIDRVSIVMANAEGLKNNKKDQYRLPNTGYSEIVHKHFSSVMTCVRNNTPVTEINYSGDVVRVKDGNGVIREYDKLIITVPLSILKDNDIAFTPALPQNKLNAMDKLGMDEGVRILLKVNKPFWPQNASMLYTNGDAGVFRIEEDMSKPGTYVLSSLVKGKKAEELNNKSEDNIVDQIKKDFSKLFGKQVGDAITDSKVFFWSRMPYIKGTYSYHKVNGSMNNRKELAAPIQDKIFFAGEATSYNGNSGTINGALETAVRAANEVLSVLA